MIRVVHPRSGSRIRILTLTLHIPDPGVKKAPDPGSGSATLLTGTFPLFCQTIQPGGQRAERQHRGLGEAGLRGGSGHRLLLRVCRKGKNIIIYYIFYFSLWKCRLNSPFFKAYVLLGEEKYLERWNTHYSAVMKYLGTFISVTKFVDFFPASSGILLLIFWESTTVMMLKFRYAISLIQFCN